MTMFKNGYKYISIQLQRFAFMLDSQKQSYKFQFLCPIFCAKNNDHSLSKIMRAISNESKIFSITKYKTPKSSYSKKQIKLLLTIENYLQAIIRSTHANNLRVTTSINPSQLLEDSFIIWLQFLNALYFGQVDVWCQVQIIMSKEGQKRCKRHGCLKHYTEEENVDGACHYHPGKPIFHDLKKGWTCCNKIVYDWDEFQKLPTCAVAKHTDQKDEGNEFYKSSTVQNAANALKKEEQKVVIKDINEYNKELEAKKKQEEAAKPKTQKKEFVTKEGKFRCVNQGCRQDYHDKDNNENACKYHKGQPVFHDLKKYWSCCGKQTHDWDEFMKLPTCCIGWHSPKMA